MALISCICPVYARMAFITPVARYIGSYQLFRPCNSDWLCSELSLARTGQ